METPIFNMGKKLPQGGGIKIISHWMIICFIQSFQLHFNSNLRAQDSIR